jgi:hypothetical protein
VKSEYPGPTRPIPERGPPCQRIIYAAPEASRARTPSALVLIFFPLGGLLPAVERVLLLLAEEELFEFGDARLQVVHLDDAEGVVEDGARGGDPSRGRRVLPGREVAEDRDGGGLDRYRLCLQGRAWFCDLAAIRAIVARVGGRRELI